VLVHDDPVTSHVLDQGGYLRRWSALHGDVAPTGLVGGWLRAVYPVAARLARAGVAPSAVTLAGLVTGLVAPALAALGGHVVLAAVLLVALSGVLDGLDGAVAVLSDRVTARGAVLDTVCDRLADAAFAATLWVAGGPAGWCVAAGALGLVHEQLRGAARLQGMSEVGVVTVAERPTRIIVVAAFLLGAGLYPDAAGTWAEVGAIAGTAVGLIGLIQLAVVTWRRLP
jgi:phosphatidylglycerophosphate synthase